MTETGDRVFTVVNPKGTFPISLQVGHYLIRFYVRYAGETTRCYRCDEADHHVKDCPKPSAFRRCYYCNGRIMCTETVKTILRLAQKLQSRTDQNSLTHLWKRLHHHYLVVMRVPYQMTRMTSNSVNGKQVRQHAGVKQNQIKKPQVKVT